MRTLEAFSPIESCSYSSKVRWKSASLIVISRFVSRSFRASEHIAEHIAYTWQGQQHFASHHDYQKFEFHDEQEVTDRYCSYINSNRKKYSYRCIKKEAKRRRDMWSFSDRVNFNALQNLSSLSICHKQLRCVRYTYALNNSISQNM